MPFGASCDALGVVIDLSEAADGICKISNTPSRISKIKLEVDRILEQGWISQVDAQKLRGRMQFADAQVYGRTGKRCIKVLRDFATRRRSKILANDVHHLNLFVCLLESDEPRLVKSDNLAHVVIMTDACYERGSETLSCGLGGILVDPQTNIKQFFSCALSEDHRNLLGEQYKKQIIFEAETLCAIVSHLLWMPQLENRKAFLYVDNEGTKFSLIRGASENETVEILAQIFAENEILVKTSCWITRVSSYSNLADDPSRGRTQQLLQLGFEDISLLALSALEQTAAIMLNKVGQKGLTAPACPTVKK